MTLSAHATRVLCVALVAVASASIGQAQSVIDFSGMPKINLGPLGLTPAIGSIQIGIDNNVFNDAVSPKQDFLASVGPTLDTWLRAGRLAARLRIAVDAIYFKRHADQRAINTTEDLIIAVRANRFTPFATARYLNARERPNIEIDARVRRQHLGVGAGVQATVGPRLTMSFEGQHQELRYDELALFEGTSLQQQLNQNAVNFTGSVRYALTPLTRLVVSAQQQHDRFEFTPIRDAVTLRVSPGVEFSPSALITGRASAGVRIFNPADPRVPEFTGLVASVDLGYTHRGVTQYAIRADRDLAYSFTPAAPYFVQTSVGGSVTQRLSNTWDLVGSASRQFLRYQEVRGVTSASPEADPLFAIEGTGSSFAYGGAAGVRFGRASRLAFNVEYSARPAGFRGDYENLRYFTTITYAF